MAKIFRCRFCQHQTINHDHDDCAMEYGKGVEGNITDSYSKDPNKILSENLQAELRSDRWKWYQEYLLRQKKMISIRTHKFRLKKLIDKEVNLILKENEERLKKLNHPYNDQAFVIRIDFKIEVVEVPTC